LATVTGLLLIILHVNISLVKSIYFYGM
jgi:hypothetical protein